MFVEVEDFMIYGKFIAYQVGEIPIHKPTILILEGSQGKIILRTWIKSYWALSLKGIFMDPDNCPIDHVNVGIF